MHTTRLQLSDEEMAALFGIPRIASCVSTAGQNQLQTSNYNNNSNNSSNYRPHSGGYIDLLDKINYKNDARVANVFGNPDYNATINLLQVLHIKTTHVIRQGDCEDNCNSNGYDPNLKLKNDRFGIVQFYKNDCFGSKRCYYSMTGAGYGHESITDENGAIDGNINNYASSLYYYSDRAIKIFIDLYFRSSIGDKLKLKFGNKSIDYISDLILLYFLFDSHIYQFSRKKNNSSPYGKMILFNHFDNISVANEIAAEEKKEQEQEKKVQFELSNINKNVRNISDIIKIKTNMCSKFDRYLSFGKEKIDEYYIGYNNGCVFNNSECSYCLQIGIFAMSFATSVEFLRDFSDNNNNTGVRINTNDTGNIGYFTHSKFHQLFDNAMFKRKYKNKIDVSYVTFEYGISASAHVSQLPQIDVNLSPFDRFITFENMSFARYNNKKYNNNDFKRAIKGNKIAKKLLPTTMYIGCNENRSKQRQGIKTFLTQPNGVFKIKIIDNITTNGVGYFNGNICKIEIECNSDYSMSKMDSLHTFVGINDFPNIIGKQHLWWDDRYKNANRNKNDRIVFLPAVTVTGCDVCKNENCGFNFFVSHVSVK